ncbi:unnamed protein product [Penicillium salamii]|nr:unnamed protein product [Penicillium salamii]CAG8241326.1 unnamed protein product [Penicillium salamii]CAG8402878.1 unnamed protein product [Penicillium salamii]
MQDRQEPRVELLSEKQKAPGRFSWSSITLDTWILETVSLVFSIACLMSIYGILFAYNGKPRPEFSYNISLNAIVSVLATACKSSLIFVVGAGLSQLKWVWFQNRRKLSSIQAFEDASRGPMGSIWLLFRHKGRSIASLGAMILILMLAFEPFVQQILNYPTERIRISTETPAAAAPQVQYYDHWLTTYNLTSAYYTGIWTKDFNLEPTCPSGDCTWPSYKSFGFCSQCSDITSTATLDCAMPSSNHKAAQNTSLNGTCEVVLSQGRPSGTRLEATFRNGTFDLIKFNRDVVWETESHPVLDGSVYFRIENPLIVMAHSTLNLNNTRITNLSDPTEGIFIAKVIQCAFNFCVKEYKPYITNGIIVVKRSSSDFGKTENLTGPEINRKSSLLCWISNQISNDIERHYNISYPMEFASPRVISLEFTYCDFGNKEKNVFTGSMLTGLTVDTYWRTNSSWESNQRDGGLDVVLQILILGLDVIGSRVADSMTKTLLQNSDITIPGSIYANQVMVRVQWAWMILPTLLVILGIVFLVWTTCASRKKIVWKSSVLAFLFHGLEDQRERDNCMTGSGMEKLAEAMHVQLHPSQDYARVMLREN